MSFNIQDLDKVDDNNQQNWPEGTQKVNEVNNAGRADEGMLARWFADYNGSKTTTGTASALVVDLDTAPTAYYNGLTIVARVHVNVAANATLNAGGLGAATIKKNGGQDLKEGDLVSQTVGVFVSDGSSWTLTSVAIPNIGTEVGDLIVLEDVNGSAGLPAVDGSQLTGIQSASDFGCVLQIKNTNTLELAPTYPGGGVWIYDGASAVYRSLTAGSTKRGTTYPEIATWGASTLGHVYARWDSTDADSANHFVYLSQLPGDGWVWNTSVGFLTRDAATNQDWTAIGAAETTAANQFSITDTFVGVRTIYNETDIRARKNNDGTKTMNSNSVPVIITGMTVELVVLPNESWDAQANINLLATAANNWVELYVGDDDGIVGGGDGFGPQQTEMPAPTYAGGKRQNAQNTARKRAVSTLVCGEGTNIQCGNFRFNSEGSGGMDVTIIRRQRGS